MCYTLRGSYAGKDVRTLSYVVARMQKMKADNLVGIGNHNQRRTDNHSNKDIDVDLSHLNYDLVEGRTENYKRDIEKFINENKASQRATRKDAVLVNEWIISSDRFFFDELDDKETERFFEDAKDFFAERFGDENIRYAQVHLDERTPHMHLGIVPFDDENKLSAKRVFNKAALQEVQEELPKYLNERGFELQRGEKGSDKKHLPVEEYKAYKDAKFDLENEISALEREVKQRKDEVKKLITGKYGKLDYEKLGVKNQLKTVEVKTGEKNIFGVEKTETKRVKTGNVVMLDENFRLLAKNYEELVAVKRSFEKYLDTDLIKENKALDKVADEYMEMAYKSSDVANELKAENDRLREENKSLKEQVQSLKQEVKSIYHTVRDILKRAMSNSNSVKGLMSVIAEKVSEDVPKPEFGRLDDQERMRERKRTRGMSR